MALIIKDRVKETTTTTGTGTITLAGASTGFRSFADIGNANTTYYTIAGGNDWEVGLGTYTASGTTLSRDTVLSNSLGTTALINFSAGDKDVFVTYPSEKALLGDTSAVSSTGTGSVVLSNSPTFTTAITSTGALQLTGSATVNQNIATSQTTGNLVIGGSGAASGIITVGQSTGNQTVNIATGANTANKTVNIGTNASTGATIINIGTGSATTVSINGILVGKSAGVVTANTRLGEATLASNTTGTDNTAIGNNALTVNQSGNSNVAVGRLAMRENISGGGNLGIGRDALRRNTSGSDNTALGQFALAANTISTNSVAVGNQALFVFNSTTTLGDNTAVGSFALNDLTTGTQNIALGNSARTLNVTDNNSIIIGYNQRGLGSNTTSIGNANTTTARIFGNLSSTGTFSPQQATTASAPAYVKGAIYFDTTLNKLRVGGATGWETITSI